MRRFPLLLLLLLPFAAPMGAASAEPGYDRHTMMRAIADSWLDAQRPDGFVPYGFDFLTGEATDDPKSNGFMVREAGTFWVWGRYYAVVRDERYREALRRGLAALADRSIPFGKSRAQGWLELTGIYAAPLGRMTLTEALRRAGLLYRTDGSGKVVSSDGTYDAWTGSTALALLAELAYARTSGDQRFASMRAAWRDALVDLHIRGGGFRMAPASIDDSDYFNGEAWLALAGYAALDPNDERVQHTLAEVDAVLMARYSERPSMTFFQWGAMAAAQRWQTTHDARFVAYLAEQAEVVSERLERRHDETGNLCPAMEGLAVAEGVLMRAGDAHRAIARRLHALLDRAALRLPNLQIARGQTQLRLGGDASLTAPALARFPNAFLWGAFAPQTRVDAAAHCLSALLFIDDNSRLGEARDGAAMAPRNALSVKQ
jgi:hypothetical protein